MIEVYAWGYGDILENALRELLTLLKVPITGYG